MVVVSVVTVITNTALYGTHGGEIAFAIVLGLFMGRYLCAPETEND